MTYHPSSFYHLDLSKLRFDVFSSEEKKRLSVVEIERSSLLDPYSDCPIIGGLYDPNLGPYDRDAGSCYKCGNSYVKCTGHMGHIKLCVDVYNRIFGETIFQILRMSCLRDGCFKLQFTSEAAQVLILQLKLIEMGYVKEPQELEIFKISSDSECIVDMSKERKEKIAEYSNLLKIDPLNDAFVNTKTTEELQISVRSAAVKNKREKRCIHCEKLLETFTYTRNKLYMTISKEKLQSGKETITKAAREPILPPTCRAYLRDVYQHNAELLNHLFPVLKSKRDVKYPVDIFFTDIILVTPPNSRPQCKLSPSTRTTTHHPQTTSYINIINANEILRTIMSIEAGKDGGDNKELSETVVGKSMQEKQLNAWQELQSCVDQLWDINMGQLRGGQGLKQNIEKKEGIIRMHMLGKRVNHAGRTVITPDPYISVDEIGIPEIFAKKLTYPVPVTEWNVADIRKYVLNGPDIYPGANFIQNEKGHNIAILKDDKKREAMAKTLLVSKIPIIVHRHLINGDILLLNRQPSLHRPSIMAHKVRVMKGEKTLRLHYSNCKSYNADFDGDEMNCHCPQNEVARSEAYNLVNVANQYLVPKDGTPLGGLIQDHVIAGFKMSLRGRFFNREDYQQLVFVGLSHINRDIKLLPPAIMKPKKLWSGKQVLSTIIINVIPKQCAPINLKSNSKIKADHWTNQEPREMCAGGTRLIKNDMTESEVIIRGGEVLVGVLDKTHFGATPYGLIHSMYELYGGACSTQLLSSFSKLLIFFLQREGFTLGVHDILVQAEADKKRRKIIRKSRKIGDRVTADVLKAPSDMSPSELAIKVEEEYGKNGETFRKDLDRGFKQKLSAYSSDISNTSLSGLVCKFPDNNLQLMVESGAKGSVVNTMQISCSLGQIELEGKRPPLMISGKSLPSFATFETSPKSRGFIDGRFMTGIAPQDFFFHCMAGREGLIDTAVKTSRSGYLQRCLIKHLEGLQVHYDMTVRDSDNSVVQFMYGEDGMDIAKAPFLKSGHLGFLDANATAIVNDEITEKLRNDENINKAIKKHKHKLKEWEKARISTTTKRRFTIARQSIEEEREKFKIQNAPHPIVREINKEEIENYKKQNAPRPDPIVSLYRPDNYFGAMSESLEKLCNSYLRNNRSRKHKFTDLMSVKSMTSLVAPGEPVGLLAAQSIGEPSTQMTLNTFHFAGRGEMNVTLGIPRLQEILMRASKNLKTPYVDIPFKAPIKERKADGLRLKLNRVTVADVLESIHVKTFISLNPNRVRMCVFRLNFLPRELYCDEYCVKPKQIIKYVERKFFELMFKAMSAKKPKGGQSKKKAGGEDGDEDADADANAGGEDANNLSGDEDEAGKEPTQPIDSDDELVDDEDDATAAKLKNKNVDEVDYDEVDSDAEQEENDEDNLDEEERNNPEVEFDDLDETVVYKNAQEYVFNKYGNAKDYKFDQKDYLWCELTFDLPVTHGSVDFSTLLRDVASKAVISQVRNIKRAIRDETSLKTDGINIAEMFKYDKLLELNRLYTNDIHEVAKTYGIEAAARVIVREIQAVFNVYGITVDTRHLLLIADYMTFNGTFQPLNRSGMQFHASPLQQMSFEASIKSLQTATVFNRCDNLETPASRIMVGKPCKGGTGLMTTLLKIDEKTIHG